MTAYPRHTTLSEEERERLGTGMTKLDKHQCCVTYPDGTTGTCDFERHGPTYARLSYRYGDEGILLSRTALYEKVDNTRNQIETLCQSKAEAAFLAAADHERVDFFARVTYPAGGARKVDPNRATLKQEKAKRVAGKYAVCLRLPSGKLLAVSRIYDTLGEANNRYLAEPKADCVVACASRLDRRWMVPKYNPLHREYDFRKEVRDGRD